MKLRTEVLRAVRRRQLLMREEDLTEWTFVLALVQARTRGIADPHLVAERCWVLWWPHRADLPDSFPDCWSQRCLALDRMLQEAKEPSRAMVADAQLRAALGLQAGDLSRDAEEVLKSQLVALARVAALTRGQSDA